jgi:ribosomal protein L16/L10AE
VISIDSARRNPRDPRDVRAATTRPALPGVEQRWLMASALALPDVRAALGITLLQAGAGAPIYRPALMARATVTLEAVDGVGRLEGGTIARILYPAPAAAAELSWEVPDAVVDDAWLRPAPAAGARFADPPAWLTSPLALGEARAAFERTLRSAAAVWVPACPPMSLFGRPGEALAEFRARLGDGLRATAERSVGRLEGLRDMQEGAYEQRLEELRELLEMDQRELALLDKASEAYRRASESTKLRIQRFRALAATRDQALSGLARDAAAVEFSALDKLVACKLVAMRVGSTGVRSPWLGVVWVPDA